MNCNPNECREGRDCECSADISRAVLADRIIQVLFLGTLLVLLAEALGAFA